MRTAFGQKIVLQWVFLIKLLLLLAIPCAIAQPSFVEIFAQGHSVGPGPRENCIDFTGEILSYDSYKHEHIDLRKGRKAPPFVASSASTSHGAFVYASANLRTATFELESRAASEYANFRPCRDAGFYGTSYWSSSVNGGPSFLDRITVQGPFVGTTPVPVFVRVKLQGVLTPSAPNHTYINQGGNWVETTQEVPSRLMLSFPGIFYHAVIGDPSLAPDPDSNEVYEGEGSLTIDRVFESTIYAGSQPLEIYGYLNAIVYNGGFCDAKASVELIVPAGFSYTSESGFFPQPGVEGNNPPTANTGGPYSINHGDGLTLDGSGSVDNDIGDGIATYSWDLNGDGQFEFTSGDPVLSLSEAQLVSLGALPGIFPIYLWVTDNFGAMDVASTTVEIRPVPGSLKREIFQDISGLTLGELAASPKFPGQPDVVDTLPTFESKNLGDNYGTRLSGYLRAPVTGQYTFYLAADDNAQLWLSLDHDPANKSLIVSEPEWNLERNWLGATAPWDPNLYKPGRASQPITLEAGKFYYLEALQKEGEFGDHISVNWKLPGGSPPPNGSEPIAGPYLFERLPQLTQTITFASLTDRVFGNGPFTLTATASSGLPVSFESLTPDVIQIVGNSVTIVGTGIATIRASQSGNDAFLPAQDVEQSFTVTTCANVVTSFQYDHFSSTSGVGLFKAAKTADGALRLTDAASQNGAAIHSGRLALGKGFDTTFSFRISAVGGANDSAGAPGGDGLALVIQSQGATYTGPTVGYIPYSIPNAVAVEIDTWMNGNLGDPNGNHISIQNPGSLLNGIDEFRHDRSLGSGTPSANLSDGQPHTIRIRYRPGSLEVFLDGGTIPVATALLDLEAINDGQTLDACGSGWLSLVAGTGAAYETHDILSWSFQALETLNDAPVTTSQHVSTAEDTPLAVVLTATDSDGDALAFSITGGPFQGVISGTPPELTYAPNANFNGTDQFTFLVNDGNGGTVLATIFITVTPANDAPITTSQHVSTAEDTPLAVILTATDPDGDALAFSITGGPFHGVISGTPPELTYAPNANFNGTDQFTFLVNDGKGGAVQATIFITVTPANDAPITTSQHVSTAEDTPLAVVLRATDPDGDALAFSITGGPFQGSISGTPPELTYTPNANFNGEDQFTFLVNDGKEGAVQATIFVTVTPVNDAPRLENVISDQSSVYGASYYLLVPVNTFVDADTDQTLIYSASGLPPGINFNPATREFSGAPTAIGTFEILLKATDNGLSPLSATTTFPLTVGKAMLVATGDEMTKVYGTENPPLTGTLEGVVNGDIITASYGTTATASSDAGVYTVYVTLNDPDQKLGNYNVAISNGALRIERAPQTITFGEIPPHVYGDAPFVVPVSASSGLPVTLTSSVATVGTVAGTTLTINGAGTTKLTAYQPGNSNYLPADFVQVSYTVGKAIPVITWATPTSIVEGTALTTIQLNATANVPGSFTYNHPLGTKLSPGDHVLNASFTPTDAANYTSASASITIAVKANTPPVALDDTFTTDEKSVLVVNEGGVLANDTDADEGPLPKFEYEGWVWPSNGDLDFTYGQRFAGYYHVDPNGPASDHPDSTLNFQYVGANAPWEMVFAGTGYAFRGGSTIISAGNNTTFGDRYTATLYNGNSFGTPLPSGRQLSFVQIDPYDPVSGGADFLADDSIQTTWLELPLSQQKGGRFLFRDSSQPSLIFDRLIGPKRLTKVNGIEVNSYPNIALASTAVLRVHPNGSFSYDPRGAWHHLAGGETAVETITYEMSDRMGATAIATAAITVTGANDSPVLVNAIADQSTTYGASFQFALPESTFVDVDTSQTLTYSVLGLPPGLAFDSANRIIGGAATKIGTFEVRIEAADTGIPPLKTSTTFTINVGTALLVATADEVTKVYGAENPPLTGSLTGVIAEDNITASYSTTATTTSDAGVYTVFVTLNDPDGKLGNYDVTKSNGALRILRAPQTITFAEIPPHVYGDAAFSVPVSASSGLPITLTSSAASVATVEGNMLTIRGAGPTQLTAYQPGNANYLPAQFVAIQYSVGKATPVLSWNAPTAITVGTPLSSEQLNASANVAGTFAYNPPDGTVLPEGTGQPILTTFTPADTQNYNVASASVLIDVVPFLPPAREANFEWVRHFNERFLGGLDGAEKMIIDQEGNIIVTGTSGTTRIGSQDIVTVKYDPAGNKVWEKAYDGGDGDYAGTIAVDLTGNVYTAGITREGLKGGTQGVVVIKYGPEGDQRWTFRHEVSIYGSTVLSLDTQGNVHIGSMASENDGRVGFVIWKLNSSGEVLWTANYNRPSGEQDFLRGIVVDLDGNVYTTGTSTTAGLSDCVTVKFNSEGDLLWAAPLERIQNLNSGGSNVVLDGSGGVYVTGSAQSSNGWNDSIVIRYSGTGDKLWEARYNGLANGRDDVKAIAVDSLGNVVMTGISYGINDGVGSDDIFTIKYSPAGSQLWAARYNGGASGWDSSSALVTDSDGRVYVIGSSGSRGVTIAYGSDGTLLWTYEVEDGDSSNGIDLAVNPSGELYLLNTVSIISGIKGGQSDFLTAKLTTQGETIWSRRYDGHQSATEWPVGVGLDNAGNAIIAGGSYSGHGSDFLTVKYDPAGNMVWSRHYREEGDYNSEPIALAVDPEGNSYVTGYSYNVSTANDIVTIKYDRNGTLVWSVRYIHNENTSEQPASIAVDDLGNVYILGTRWSGDSKMLLVKYSSTGELMWVAERDRAVFSPWLSRKSLVIDPSGNVLAAASFYDPAGRLVYGAVKYSPDGQQLWSFRNDQQTGASSSIRSLSLDQVGDIVITGIVHQPETSPDWLTIKLSSEGMLQWEKSFSGPEDSFDEVYDMAVDNGRNIYLTGRTANSQRGYGRVITVKYDADGAELWVVDHVEAGLHSTAESLVVDSSGNVFVGAYSWSQTFPSVTPPSFNIIKYRPDGTQSWVHRYTRDSAYGYWLSDLALDGRGGIYVVGETWGGSFDDLTTIKLSDPDVPPLSIVSALNPSTVVANSGAFLLNVTGQNFDETSVVHWNGEPRPTTIISDTQLSAQISSDDLAGISDITVVRITVGEPGAPLSNPAIFTIIPSTVGDISVSQVTPGQIGSISSVSDSSDSPSVRVAVQNNGDTPVTVVAATYDSKPVGETAFRIGNGDFVDVQITGAGSTDVAGVLFYYPADITGSQEEKIKLRYFNGSDWNPVLSSGGVLPERDTRDNLDGTVSGGRFGVIFDSTSTPKITELTGTIFGMFNPAPQILSISGPNGPLAVGSTATINIQFATPIAGQSCALNLAWDDGTTTAVTSNNGTASVTHKFDAPGVYSVVVTVSDVEGGVTTQSFDYVVIYDPNGGFVTGGGWINSPIGALRSSPELKGEARFGFVSKYKKGSSVPTGQTEFQFMVGNFAFKSTSYQWLVVSGAKAQFKGSGSTNGSGEFAFLLTATDGDKAPTESDRFRIKIWEIATGLIVYDNVLNAPDSVDAASQQVISGGSIVVHKP